MTTRWWGSIPFELEQIRRWQLGGLTLQIQRASQEWQISHHRHSKQHEDEHDWQLLANITATSLMPEKSVLQRHIFNQTISDINLKPQLADRSVVIKPITPLFIAPNQQTTLFVSTPLWLNVSTEDTLLLDIPIIRPTDTWFGTTPIRGELCYATKVFARLELEQLPIRAFRAVTPIHITNHQTQSMPIERINIPAPLLTLYAAEDGRLWTPTLEVEQLSSGRAPKIHLSKQLYSRAGQVKLLNTARQNDTDNISNLFEHFFN